MGTLRISGLLAALLAVLLGRANAFQERSNLMNHKLPTKVTTNVTSKEATHFSPLTLPLVKAYSEFSLTSEIRERRSVSEDILATNNMQDGSQPSAASFIPETFLRPNPPPEGSSFLFDFETPIKTILSFCPSTKSCQKENDTNMLDFGNECCMNCECSDRCFAAGTCCLDMMNNTQHQNNTNFSSTEQSCVNTFVSGNDYKGQAFSYFLFQKCANTVDHQTRKKCLHPDVFQVDEMIPVFSRTTNRHYRNVFCSKCYNDADNLVLWQTRLSCRSSEYLSSGFPKISVTFSISLFISTNPSCRLFWDPPSNVKKTDRCIPEQDIVSDCDEPILSDLCKQYYAPVKGRSVIYRNVFCMECANPSNLTGQYSECYPDDLRLPEDSFTAILSLRIDEKVASKSDNPHVNTCPSPGTYNDNLGACIHQTCAVSKISVYDVCRPVFSKLMSIHLEYRLKLLFRVFNEDTWYSLPFIKYDKNIMDIIGITDTFDNLCLSEFFDVKFTSTSAEISAVYIKNVKSTNIQRSYKEFTKRIEAYNEIAKENKTMFSLQIDTAGVEPIPEDAVTFVKFNGSNFEHFCLNAFAMTKLQFCNTVSFNVDEFKIHNDGNISIDNLIFRPGEFVLRQSSYGSIKSVQVCLDDYISSQTIVNRKFSITSAVGYGWKQRSEILLLMCAVILRS